MLLSSSSSMTTFSFFFSFFRCFLSAFYSFLGGFSSFLGDFYSFLGDLVYFLEDLLLFLEGLLSFNNSGSKFDAFTLSYLTRFLEALSWRLIKVIRSVTEDFDFPGT